MFRGLLIISFLILFCLTSFSGCQRNGFSKTKKVDHTVAGSSSEQFMLSAFSNFPSFKIDTQNAPLIGEKDAPYKLVEFSDFECPACRFKSDTLKKILQEFKGKISLQFMHFPLDNSCNPEIEKDFHKFACLAAKYSFCFLKQGKFWQFHDELFKNQSSLKESYFILLSKKMNLDQTVLKNCLTGEAKEAIKRDLSIAKKVEVNYTPTIFLNGKKVSDLVKGNIELFNFISSLINSSK